MPTMIRRFSTAVQGSVPRNARAITVSMKKNQKPKIDFTAVRQSLNRLLAMGRAIMSIGSVMSQIPFRENRRLPIGRNAAPAGRIPPALGTVVPAPRYSTGMIGDGARAVNDNQDPGAKPPPPVLSGEPGRELERKLKRHPDDLDAKADVGSDQSMDASD